MPLPWPPCVALVLLLALGTLTSGVRVPAAGDGENQDAAVQSQPELLMMERFHGWMAKHGRRYETPEEKLRRFEIYRSNVEFIEAANRDGRLSYTLGENLFTDLTHEEFLATYTSSGRPPPPDLDMAKEEEKPEEEEMVITTRAGHVSEQAFQQRKELPDRVNWAAQGNVTEVKYQGMACEACWAFAAVAAIESAYSIAKYTDPPVLSEQELIDCDRFDSGCRAGWPDYAMNWVKRNGILNESVYPYVNTLDNKTHDCRLKQLRNNSAIKPVMMRDFWYVKATEEDLMAAVARQPVAVAFDSTDKCFKFYAKGVYNGNCIYPGGEYVGPCSNNNLQHALTIVGYDDKDKYWIAKNSWGTKWGQQGYVWLKKDVADPKGLCGLVSRNGTYAVF